MALTKESQRAWLNQGREEIIDPEREIIDPTTTSGDAVACRNTCCRIFGKTLSPDTTS